MKIMNLMMAGLIVCIAAGCANVTRIPVDDHGVIRGPEQGIVVHEGGQEGVALGVIKADQYFHVYVDPGVREFTGMFDDGHGNGLTAHADVQAGQTYYFQIVQMPALTIQDIRIIALAESVAKADMATFTNVTPAPAPVKADKALVYFYYSLTKEEQAALKAQQANIQKLAKELHCTATEMREGACQ